MFLHLVELFAAQWKRALAGLLKQPMMAWLKHINLKIKRSTANKRQQ
jgi:hypothetical protein